MKKQAKKVLDAKAVWEQEQGNRSEIPNNWKPKRKAFHDYDGFLCSTLVARMLEEKEAEAEAAKFKKHVKSGQPISWELSEREKKIIMSLDANG